MPSRHFTTRTTATSLTDTVANTVRQMLIQGELRAGQRLSEAALSQQLKNGVLVVSMVPMLVLYPFLQKYFVKGIMIGSIKG